MTRAQTAEIMLALRSPDAGWLGVLACVIDEASRDGLFDERQRAFAQQLLQAGPLPAPLVDAARQRADRFEAELGNNHYPLDDVPSAAERPKLTLVGH
ncbi:MAG TPA: hypothetical protein VF269_08220 [Rhodanobacteraceae bacterium]